MRAAFRWLILAGLLAAAACSKSRPEDQNIAIADNSLARADVETLPPDESVGTPSNQLINGNDNPDVNISTNTSD